MKRLFKILVISVTVLFAFASCSLFLSESKEVSMSVTGTPDSYTRSMVSSTAIGEEGVTTVRDDETIVVTKVEMVIFELELEVDSDNLDSEIEDIEAGPFLFELPLNGTAANLFNGILIPEGLYEELEIEVDAPEGDVEHESFFTQNYPNWPKEVSIRVTGTFDDGTGPIGFVYQQLDFNEDFEIEFEPALQIIGGETNIVLSIDVSTWFLNEAKTGLFNPAVIDVGSSEASQVEENIENSFEVFEDSLDD